MSIITTIQIGLSTCDTSWIIKVLFFKLIFGEKLAPQKFLDGLSKLGTYYFLSSSFMGLTQATPRYLFKMIL